MISSSTLLTRRAALQRRGTRVGSDSGNVARQIEKSLDDPDPGIRVVAVQLLGNLGAAGLAGLERALADEEAVVRLKAVEVLGQGLASATVPLLIGTLNDVSAHVRIAGATALGMLGEDAEPAIACLVRGLADVNLIYSRLAAQALSRIGRAAVPALIEALAAHDSTVQREAAWALGQMGPIAESALPALESVLNGSAFVPAPVAADANSDPDRTVVCVVVTKGSGSSARVPGNEKADVRLRLAVSLAIDRIRGGRR